MSTYKVGGYGGTTLDSAATTVVNSVYTSTALEMTMPTPSGNRFEAESATLQEQLDRAILEEDLARVGLLAAELEECWSFAVAHGDREGLRHVNDLLLRIVDTAQVLVHEEFTLNTIEGWAYRWETLAEVGGKILQGHQSSAAREAREALKALKASGFTHAESVISLLYREGVATHKEIQETLKIESQACNNHLRRLAERHLITRVARGLYRLTGHGLAVAEAILQAAPGTERGGGRQTAMNETLEKTAYQPKVIPFPDRWREKAA